MILFDRWSRDDSSGEDRSLVRREFNMGRISDHFSVEKLSMLAALLLACASLPATAAVPCLSVRLASGQGRSYELADIERVLGDLNNASQETFFDRHVNGTEKIDISRFLALADIEITEEDGRTVIRVREDASPDTDAIRRGLFGAISAGSKRP